MRNRVEEFYRDGIRVRLGVVGAVRYLKASWPVRYGCFHEISTPAYIFQFSPEGVIRFMQGRPGTWYDHSDWFKRTAGGDWVYYSSGGYNGAISSMGEHYIPLFAYPSNNVIGEKRYPEERCQKGLDALASTLEWADARAGEAPVAVGDFLRCIVHKNQPDFLGRLAHRFHHLTRGPLTVLPPDSRHVDYDILPVRLAEGCLYHCRFCGVKSPRPFAVGPQEDVADQVALLGDYFKGDLVNMGGVFLGEHDALAAGAMRVVAAAEACHALLEAGRGLADTPSLFLFGSPDALVGVSDAEWATMARLPFKVWINTGIESLDEATLHFLGRPTSLALVTEAVRRADAVMRRHENISISLNMVTGDALPPTHDEALTRFVASRDVHSAPIYLSPLKSDSQRHAVMERLIALKRISRAPLFLYLLQRL